MLNQGDLIIFSPDEDCVFVHKVIGYSAENEEYLLKYEAIDSSSVIREEGLDAFLADNYWIPGQMGHFGSLLSEMDITATSLEPGWYYFMQDWEDYTPVNAAQQPAKELAPGVIVKVKDERTGECWTGEVLFYVSDDKGWWVQINNSNVEVSGAYGYYHSSSMWDDDEIVDEFNSAGKTVLDDTYYYWLDEDEDYEIVSTSNKIRRIKTFFLQNIKL